MNAVVEKIKTGIHDLFDLDLLVKNLKEHAPRVSAETMGWIAGNRLKEITEPYNVDKDISFFGDKASNFIVVQPLEFIVFFPGDGHQPQLFDGTIKKLIVKILV